MKAMLNRWLKFLKIRFSLTFLVKVFPLLFFKLFLHPELAIKTVKIDLTDTYSLED